MLIEPPRRPEDRSDIALPSEYQALGFGESVSLYQGQLAVSADGQTLIGDGQLTLNLKGDPRINFSVSLPHRVHANMTNAANVQVTAPEFGCTGPALVQTVSVSFGTTSKASLSGILNGAGIEFSKQKADGKPESIGRVLFHLLNFPDYYGTEIQKIGSPSRPTLSFPGRVTFPFGEWTVTLDKLPDVNKRLQAAEAEHGYAFTHVGRFDRTDGRLFSPEAAQKTIEALSWFFSFARGARCTCVLPVGYRHLPEPLWWQWQSPLTAPARHCQTWFTEMAPYACFGAADRFAACWKDSAKRKWLTFGIGLYCAGNQSGHGVDLQLAESQIPLELLTCVAFLEENSLMSEKAFEGLSAADKIRVLLFWLETPATIPARYGELTKYAQENKSRMTYADAPEVVTEIRNAIIHPTRSNRAKRDKISDMAIYEAWQLNMWYVELALLKLIGHSGPYCNRTTATMQGAVDTLPWTPT